MPNPIQPGEYSMGSGTDGAAHITDSNGNPSAFNVERNDDGRSWLNNDWANPDNRWNLDNRLLFHLRNSLYFSSARAGEFCFCNCPCHPPSILPALSSWVDRAIYCLSRNDFVSHSTITNSLRVSSFRIAKRTYGDFSSRFRNAAAEAASITSTNNVSIFSPRV